MRLKVCLEPVLCLVTWVCGGGTVPGHLGHKRFTLIKRQENFEWAGNAGCAWSTSRVIYVYKHGAHTHTHTHTHIHREREKERERDGWLTGCLTD